MIKVDIFSGFLGAGKTTLIKKLLAEAYKNEKVVLIENEFGDIAIDGGFLKDTGVVVNEMNSGCICCTLKGDFTKALKEVADKFSPERIIIEPSGVGKLSDVIDAVTACGDYVTVNAAVAVADAKKCKMYLKNFGEFFRNQIESAGAVILSRTGMVSEEKTAEALELIKGLNPDATVITTPWEQLEGEEILKAAELKASLTMELAAMVSEQEHHHHHHDDDCDCGCHDHEHHHHHDDDCDCGCHDHEHHHHHHDDDCDCGCHDHEHHHHHDDDCDCGCYDHEHHHHDDDCDCGCHDHEHHHHHHDDDCDCGCHDHEHHHHHDDDCDCGCHDHEHHHHHHADEVFSTFGTETNKKFSEQKLREVLDAFDEGTDYGTVLRAKGYLDCDDGEGWLWFDYVPGEADIRRGDAAVTGRICVIGAGIKEEAIKELLGL